jgi:hypothetical protein
LEAFVDRSNIVCTHQTLADSLLIGDYDQVRCPFSQHSKSRHCPREPFKLLPAPDVVTYYLPIYDPVSIQKETPVAALSRGDESSDAGGLEHPLTPRREECVFDMF